MKQLLKKANEIWGDEKCSLPEILVRMGVVYGDLCRICRDGKKSDLKKEMGNIIFSTIRWCDDLGLNVDECIKEATECQESFVRRSHKS